MALTAILLVGAAPFAACSSSGGGSSTETPDASEPVDSGLPDAGEPDGGQPDAGPTGDLALTRAFSADGTTVYATFSRTLDPASVSAAAFRVDSETQQGVSAVSAVEVDHAEVTVTLATPLAKGAQYRVAAIGVRDDKGIGLDPTRAQAPLKGTLHVALIWHQHQPVYMDPVGDYLRGPWVRKHGTKDYFDMAAVLRGYPDVHVNVNLTPVLLSQLKTYYLDRLGPYVNVQAGTIDTTGYFAQRTSSPEQPIADPWIDMLLRATPAPETLSDTLKGWFYKDIWSNFSISDVMIARFPEYKALRDKRDTAPDTFTQDDLLQMKGWFQLAWFDPDFLRGPVTMPDNSVVNLSDLVTENGAGEFRLKAPFAEATCKRLVVEEFKILSNIVAMHRALMYDADAKTGQIEVMTTPFYHPILPLLVDTDLAKQAMPTAALPQQRFQHADDARAHIAKAVKLFQDQFGRAPTGMWPAEGAVAEEVVPLFAEAGIKWIATDRRVLEKSTPANQPLTTPYRVDGPVAGGTGQLAIVFRDTEISDKLGFAYQGGTPEANVADLKDNLRRYAPLYGEDRLLSVILDGENAWEWYRLDNDGKGFVKGMYAALTAAQQRGEFRTTTVSEYLSGNTARHIAAHPTSALPHLEPLWAGSWINGNYDTWIGEYEENLAWDYLAKARSDLAGFNLARPDPSADPPAPGNTVAWHTWKAWESLYAAEGSDWFWWYGDDQTAVGGDQPFDRLFTLLLKDVYNHAIAAGAQATVPDFPPILRYCAQPAAQMTCDPTLDGAFVPDDGNVASQPNEWTRCGAGACADPDSGATTNPNDTIATWYHGTTSTAIDVALRTNGDLSTRVGTNFQVRLYFSHKHIVSLDTKEVQQDPKLDHTRSGAALSMTAGGAAREVTVDFSGTAPAAKLAAVSGTSWGAPAAAPTVQVGFASNASTNVLELSVPKALLNYQSGDPLELVIVVDAAGAELDRAPNSNAIVLFQDRTRLVEVTFVLDATGMKLPLNAVKAIDNPPPPAGTGKAFIVGNLTEIGNWTPNSVAMSDDGSTLGDAVANDNLWSFRLLVAPLTEVQYKYTIGDQGQGWGPTEEFPLTNRGISVSDSDGDGKMVIKDVFADRPDPSGSKGKLTTIVNP